MTNTRKVVSEFVIASVLALSAVAPALAAAEESTLLERNAYFYTAGGDARAITQQDQRLSNYRAVNALAYAPAQVYAGKTVPACATNEGYGRFSYESC